MGIILFLLGVIFVQNAYFWHFGIARTKKTFYLCIVIPKWDLLNVVEVPFSLLL